MYWSSKPVTGKEKEERKEETTNWGEEEEALVLKTIMPQLVLAAL